MDANQLVSLIINTNIQVAADVGADYDDESIEIDRDYLEGLGVEALQQELAMARLGTQFDQ